MNIKIKQKTRKLLKVEFSARLNELEFVANTSAKKGWSVICGLLSFGSIWVCNLYIYKTEAFEASTIFHVSTIFKYNIKTK